jgi:hypothetical protein
MNVLDIHAKQRVLSELFTVEDSSLIEVHICLRSVYGEDAIDVS